MTSALLIFSQYNHHKVWWTCCLLKPSSLWQDMTVEVRFFSPLEMLTNPECCLIFSDFFCVPCLLLYSIALLFYQRLISSFLLILSKYKFLYFLPHLPFLIFYSQEWDIDLLSYRACQQLSTGVFVTQGSYLLLWTGNFLLFHTTKCAKEIKIKNPVRNWILLGVKGCVWPQERGGLLIISLGFTLCAFKLSFYFHSTCLFIPMCKTIYRRYKSEHSSSQGNWELSEQCPHHWHDFFSHKNQQIVLKCWKPMSEHI